MRCFNFGIAEPNQVGASAGMALAGHTVFAQVFGPFLPVHQMYMQKIMSMKSAR